MVRRIMMLIAAAAAVAVMMAASAMPALAQGPPTIPPGAGIAVGVADTHNPVIDVTSVASVPTCITLNAPPDNTQVPGHHSDYPDFCSQ